MGSLLLISVVTLGTPWLVIMVLLGATIGIVMGLSYPFALFVKLAYVLGVIVSGIAVALGIRYSAKIYGQVLAVAGIIAWSTLGVFGLGTGS